MAAICYNEIKYWREKLKNRRESLDLSTQISTSSTQHSPKLNDNRLGFLQTIITLKLRKKLVFVISKINLVPPLPPFSKK